MTSSLCTPSRGGQGTGPGPRAPGTGLVSPPCPLHFECERYQPAEHCEYRSGELTYAQAEEEADSRGGFPR